MNIEADKIGQAFGIFMTNKVQQNFTNKNYLPSLTWLRAIAAFLVVISHAIRTVEGPWTKQTESLSEFFTSPIWYARLFDLGTFGVYLFFSLSGFTLYLSNQKELNKWKSIPSFYIKRIARIWPTFLISLIIYTLFALFFWPHYNVTEATWIKGNFVLPNSITSWLSYIFLTFDLTGPAGMFVGPYWSLPIEFHYYLLMAPVTIFMTNLSRLRFLVPTLFGITLMYFGTCEHLPIADKTILNMALSFFLGVSLSDLYTRNLVPSLKNHIVIGIFLCVIFLTISFLWQGFLPVWLNDPVYIIFPPLTVYVFLNIKLKNLNGRFIQFLEKYGTYSYSIYLFHMLSYATISLCASLLKIKLDESMFLPVFIIGFISSYLLASLSYHWIEIPSIHLGRKIAK